MCVLVCVGGRGGGEHRKTRSIEGRAYPLKCLEGSGASHPGSVRTKSAAASGPAETLDAIVAAAQAASTLRVMTVLVLYVCDWAQPLCLRRRRAASLSPNQCAMISSQQSHMHSRAILARASQQPPRRDHSD